MPRYKLTIAYDGTDFAGWQKQEPPVPGASEQTAKRPDHLKHPNPLAVTRPQIIDPTLDAPDGRVALRTVQAVVERAVREIVREPVAVRGASRTDSGVHARGQVAAFSCSGDTPDDHAERAAEKDTDGEGTRGGGWPIARGTDRLLRALNGRLPEDVLAVGADVVRDDFDPIGHCVSKGYAYRLHVSPTRPLWERRYVQQVWQTVDVERMNEAAERIIGEHDFAAFAAAGHGRMSTVREVHRCEVKQELQAGAPEKTSGKWPGPLRVEVSGNGFLYNMVRIITGTLVEVGRGRMSADDVARALESGDRRLAGPTMPAQGLCLEWIRYQDETVDCP